MDVARFDFDYSERKQFCFGLFSDIHLDSPGHERKHFEADVEAVIAKGGRLLFNGDLYDAIMPTDRKRYSRAGDIKQGDAQVNELVELGVKRLGKYADYIDYLGFGNHEASIVKYNNTDILALLAFALKEKRSPGLPPIKRGGYVGFINLVFSDNGSRVRRFVIYRDHGKGANSPVTHGILAFSRAFTTFNCDMAWFGHSHNSLVDDTFHNIGISAQGNFYRKKKFGVITAGYQKCFTPTIYDESHFYKNNFPEERFYGPTSTGMKTLTIDIVDNKLIPKVI